MSINASMHDKAYRNLLDAYDVNISLPAIPAMSRTRKLSVAESDVAPDLPTPTPSKTFCVASTEQRDVVRYWILSSSIHKRYPDSDSVAMGTLGRKVLFSTDCAWGITLGSSKSLGAVVICFTLSSK
jgi:hypothetical protein